MIDRAYGTSQLIREGGHKQCLLIEHFCQKMQHFQLISTKIENLMALWDPIT
ncbi:hypothetical protein HMPREF1567_2160 [Providencia alcalifaciens PAL-2]|nr:hypothetical protein HMPREF1562_1566 [Providencia alcalifaciens F90-2004]EUC95014.1 hypothetical protein HMPREF1567_2160 [Providencia alcalifaciens PAL-2]